MSCQHKNNHWSGRQDRAILGTKRGVRRETKAMSSGSLRVGRRKTCKEDNARTPREEG